MSASIFEPYYKWGWTGQEGDQRQVIQARLEELRVQIDQVQAGDAARRELQELLQAFKEESDKEQPSAAVQKAILGYLERESELRSLVVQVKNIILG
jgi:hypothetical protein